MKRILDKLLIAYSPMLKKKFLFFLFSIVIISSIATLIFYSFAIDITSKIPSHKNSTNNQLKKEKENIYVGVISRYPPNIIFKGYQPIIDYLNTNPEYNFELKLSTSYSETVDQLISGEVSVAFFGSLLYVNAHKRFGIIPVLKPLNEDFKPFFRSVLFTKKNSTINSVLELKGKKIALPSKESFSGTWLIEYELKKYKLNQTDFAEIKNFPYHQNVIYQVINGNFDAGIVKDRVIKSYDEENVKIIHLSEPVPGSPLVTAKNYDTKVIEIIKSLLLKIDLSKPNYKELVKNWDKEFIYGFVEASDADYDLIRKFSGAENQ